MSAPVATAADVRVTPGTIPFTGAASGTWTAPAPPVVEQDPKLRIGGQPAIYQATCTFVFNGASSGGTAVTGQEDVELTAGTTKLQKSENQILLDGDQKQSSFGNTVRISSTRKLKSD